MNTRALQEYRASLTLSSIQREMLWGMLLGDAHLEQQSTNTARLKVEHSVDQRDYVTWKYENWREWVLTPPQLRIKHNRLGSASTNIWFNTIAHPELVEWRKRFYDENRKRVPSDFVLTPLALAIWFMDDGSRKSRECRGLYLNVQCYTRSEVERLQDYLMHDFGLRTTTRQQSDGLQIYIPSSEVTSFARMVSPYVIASMRYKLPG